MNSETKTFVILIFSFFFFHSSIAQLGLAISSQKCYGGSRNDFAKDVLQLPDGGYMVVGSSFSNDGDVSGHRGSLDSADAWIFRLTSDGRILWQQSMGGSGRDEFNSLIRGVGDTFYVVGSTESRNGDLSGIASSGNAWVLKMTTSGSVIWSKRFRARLNDGVYTPTGVVFAGTATQNNEDVQGFFGGSDAWVIKLGHDGDKIWSKCYGSTSFEVGSDITLGPNGQLWLLAYKNPSSTVYYDGIFTINPENGIGGGVNGVGMPRFSVDGTVIADDKKVVSSFSAEPGYPLCADLAGSITSLSGNAGFEYTTPYRCVTAGMQYRQTFAPAHGIDWMNENTIAGAGELIDLGTGPTGGTKGKTDAFIGVLRNTSPNTYYFKNYGGSDADIFSSVKTLRSGNELVAAGSTSSNDKDVSGNHGGSDAWIVIFAGANAITGNVFIDQNSNGARDAGEPDFTQALITTSKPGFTVSAPPASNGTFQNDVDTGTFVTSIKINNPYYTSARLPKTSSFSSFKNTDTVNFPVLPLPGKRDYSVTAWSSNARPGFDYLMNISYSNQGTDTMNNREIRLIKPSKTTFISSNPMALASGDTLRWFISSLPPFQKGTININLKIDAPPSANINDTLVSRIYIDSTGDVNKTNNAALIRQILTGSYDPNDKWENHGGIITNEEISNGDYLTYRIRFQNTGNDTAFNVTLRDTLSARVDPESIQMISASHAYTLRIEKNNIAVWDFEDIRLVDSTTNEPASNGDVVFQIRPKAGLNLGDSIKNQAAIYFDFNPPIFTNVQTTILRPAAPLIPAFTGLTDTYCGSQGDQKIRISNLPAQGSGTTTAVKLDNNILSIAADSTVTIRISELVPGQHSFSVSYSNIAGTQTKLNTFLVNPVDTLNVNLAANITTIVDLAVPVEITASNAAGGGANPLYTFAKNRTFTDILQAESTNNKLGIIPATLAVGTNWLYVRMKTSSTCFNTQFNIDSVMLERSIITGITDPDNPNQLITVFPNPYRDHVLIRGLKPLKIYIITLRSMDGRRIKDQQVTGEANTRLSLPAAANGKYLLQIIDKQKSRIIGTIPLMKE